MVVPNWEKYNYFLRQDDDSEELQKIMNNSQYRSVNYREAFNPLAIDSKHQIDPKDLKAGIEEMSKYLKFANKGLIMHEKKEKRLKRDQPLSDWNILKNRYEKANLLDQIALVKKDLAISNEIALKLKIDVDSLGNTSDSETQMFKRMINELQEEVNSMKRGMTEIEMKKKEVESDQSFSKSKKSRFLKSLKNQSEEMQEKMETCENTLNIFRGEEPKDENLLNHLISKTLKVLKLTEDEMDSMKGYEEHLLEHPPRRKEAEECRSAQKSLRREMWNFENVLLFYQIKLEELKEKKRNSECDGNLRRVDDSEELQKLMNDPDLRSIYRREPSNVYALDLKQPIDLKSLTKGIEEMTKFLQDAEKILASLNTIEERLLVTQLMSESNRNKMIMTNRYEKANLLDQIALVKKDLNISNEKAIPKVKKDQEVQTDPTEDTDEEDEEDEYDEDVYYEEDYEEYVEDEEEDEDDSDDEFPNFFAPFEGDGSEELHKFSIEVKEDLESAKKELAVIEKKEMEVSRDSSLSKSKKKNLRRKLKKQEEEIQQKIKYHENQLIMYRPLVSIPSIDKKTFQAKIVGIRKDMEMAREELVKLEKRVMEMKRNRSKSNKRALKECEYSIEAIKYAIQSNEFALIIHFGHLEDLENDHLTEFDEGDEGDDMSKRVLLKLKKETESAKQEIVEIEETELKVKEDSSLSESRRADFLEVLKNGKEELQEKIESYESLFSCSPDEPLDQKTLEAEVEQLTRSLEDFKGEMEGLQRKEKKLKGKPKRKNDLLDCKNEKEMLNKKMNEYDMCLTFALLQLDDLKHNNENPDSTSSTELEIHHLEESLDYANIEAYVLKEAVKAEKTKIAKDMEKLSVQKKDYEKSIENLSEELRKLRQNRSPLTISEEFDLMDSLEAANEELVKVVKEEADLKKHMSINGRRHILQQLNE